MLRLHSPVGAGREFDLTYNWPTDDSNEKYSEEDLAEEIRDSISFVLQDHPNLIFRIPPISMLQTYEQLNDLCDKWNSAVDVYCYDRDFIETKATLPQAQHIIGQVYNKSVACPERLNQYTAFSSHVYGETSPKMVSHMIRQLRITPNDIFLDLGSGVGQVVLQMAAAADFKLCIGIETCEVPCEYAVGLELEFRRTMKWYGKFYSKFHLYKGDFLDKPYRDVIHKSTIIFANNFAFGPEVDHHLKEIFADLEDGVRIVSSKEFSSINFRINQRNLTDIGTIMDVSAMKPFEGAVSWTNSKVSFFLHVINRTKLERYFEESKQSQLHSTDRPKRKLPENRSYGDRQKPKKKPKPKFQTKRRKKDKKVFSNFDNDFVPCDEPIQYLLKPEPEGPILTEKQDHTSVDDVMDDFPPPPFLVPQLNKVPTRCRKRKSRPPTIPSVFDLNSISSQKSVPVPAPSERVDVYADAPWRNVPLTSGPPKCVDELLARMRVQYFNMMDVMKSQNYIAKVLEDIKVERERNAALRRKKDCMEKIVNELLVTGKQLLMQRLSELGIEKDNWQSLFAELQELVHDQALLSLQKTALVKEIGVLESQGEHLKKYLVVCDIAEALKTKKVLGKALSRLTSELHEIEVKTPPSFPDSPNSDCDFSGDQIVNYHPSPRRFYVNCVKSPHQDQLTPRNQAACLPPPPAPKPSTNGASVFNVYKISPSSILPKKRRIPSGCSLVLENGNLGFMLKKVVKIVYQKGETQRNIIETTRKCLILRFITTFVEVNSLPLNYNWMGLKYIPDCEMAQNT